MTVKLNYLYSIAMNQLSGCKLKNNAEQNYECKIAIIETI